MPNSAANSKRRRLGRGLNALLGATQPEVVQPAEEDLELRHINVEDIERNPFQPRQDFDEDALNELAKSIKQHGVLQPILVRPVEDGFQLIAGERRWLASQLAGLKVVPCQVRELEDQSVNEAAIEENLKRKDLNALEKAQAFQDYQKRFQCSIEELAKKLSMTRSNVSNILRLLELHDDVKEALRHDRISFGHARSLLSLDGNDQVAMLQTIEGESLSVRKTEAAVRELLHGGTDNSAANTHEPDTPAIAGKVSPSNHVISLQNQLRDALGAKVEIRLKSEDSGKIIITFSDTMQFENILRVIKRAA